MSIDANNDWIKAKETWMPAATVKEVIAGLVATPPITMQHRGAFKIAFIQ